MITSIFLKNYLRWFSNIFLISTHMKVISISVYTMYVLLDKYSLCLRTKKQHFIFHIMLYDWCLGRFCNRVLPHISMLNFWKFLIKPSGIINFDEKSNIMNLMNLENNHTFFREIHSFIVSFWKPWFYGYS